MFNPNQAEKCIFKEQLTDGLTKEGCTEWRCRTSIILSILCPDTIFPKAFEMLNFCQTSTHEFPQLA